MKKQEFSGAAAFIESLKDKKVFVAGIGISNMPLIHFLSEKGVKNITAADSGGRNAKAREAVLAKMQKLAGDGVIKDFVVGENYLDDAYKADYIFKSPGIRFDHPGLVKAAENGSILTSEMEEFIRYCPAKIYGITGSDGKTTTTTLVKLLLEKANEST
ncbi:MAG: UDP-N-acetylmuramoyl-L-alanine--D-glutamate ligase, partial [Clostridia bacterium]|nr:UDP-N-acetylmuramoyl-L-alanine--D-glutamate ligase [Clostridia bacterium]